MRRMTWGSSSFSTAKGWRGGGMQRVLGTERAKLLCCGMDGKGLECATCTRQLRALRLSEHNPKFNLHLFCSSTSLASLGNLSLNPRSSASLQIKKYAENITIFYSGIYHISEQFRRLLCRMNYIQNELSHASVAWV